MLHPTLPEVQIESRAAWRAWLCAHHESHGSIWLVTFKKGRGPYVSYDEIVEEALCFGWIDSRPAKVDDDRTALLLSPRRRGSRWSGVNKARVAAMTARSLMAPAGLAAVDRARADGTWDALEGVDALREPEELTIALDADPAARAAWTRFPPSSRRGILEWIAAARTAQTRARRISETASKAALGIKANFPEGRNRG